MGRIISIDNEVTSQLDRIKLKMEKEAGNGENIPYGRVVKKIIKIAGMWQKKKQASED